MSQKSPARKEAEAVLGILLFAIGMGFFTLVFSPILILSLSLDQSRFLGGFIAGLFLAGGLDLIIHGARG